MRQVKLFALLIILISCQKPRLKEIRLNKNNYTVFQSIIPINETDTLSGYTTVYSKQIDTLKNSSNEIKQVQDWFSKNNKWKRVSYSPPVPKGKNYIKFNLTNELDSNTYFFTLYSSYICLTQFSSKENKPPKLYTQALTDTTFNGIKKLFITQR